MPAMYHWIVITCKINTFKIYSRQLITAPLFHPFRTLRTLPCPIISLPPPDTGRDTFLLWAQDMNQAHSRTPLTFVPNYDSLTGRWWPCLACFPPCSSFLFFTFSGTPINRLCLRTLSYRFTRHSEVPTKDINPTYWKRNPCDCHESYLY